MNVDTSEVRYSKLKKKENLDTYLMMSFSPSRSLQWLQVSLSLKLFHSELLLTTTKRRPWISSTQKTRTTFCSYPVLKCESWPGAMSNHQMGSWHQRPGRFSASTTSPLQNSTLYERCKTPNLGCLSRQLL